MAVLNVTPDSFSDGGCWDTPVRAVARGRELIEAGADLIDVGGESTRPGSTPVDPAEEQRRVLEVIGELVALPGAVPLSVDTLHATTARAAVEAGAQIVNDVSGGTADAAMLSTVAELGCLYVLQHTRGTPATMTSLAHYEDAVVEVREELARRRDQALAAGIAAERIILDPGLGFAKDAEHNWAILAHLEAFTSLGHPLLVGASRKRFLAELMPPQRAADATERDAATAALTLHCALQGVWGVRVHEPTASRDAVQVAQQLRAASAGAEVRR